MKLQQLLPTLVLSSILFLSAAAAAAAAAADSDAVLDTDGNALKPRTKYYILLSPGIGGGLKLASRNGTCPLYVAETGSEVDPGLPVRFYPADKGDGTVRLGRDANFVFSAFTICAQSTVWRIRRSDEATDRIYVSTGGVIGRPGRETLSNWFKIRQAEDGSNTYSLVYCPTVCNTCRPFCGTLGSFVENGTAWLGIGGSHLSVTFNKVYDAVRPAIQ